MIEEIGMFEFVYIPWNLGDIREVRVMIAARSRKEAELIALNSNYKFFDQDLHVKVTQIMQGYRQIKNE